MGQPLHLRHLDHVWAEEGELQASLARALGASATQAPLKLQALSPAARRRQIAEFVIEAVIDFVDGEDGDPDIEAEPVEADADLEPGLGWGGPGVQVVAGAGEDRED